MGRKNMLGLFLTLCLGVVLAPAYVHAEESSELSGEWFSESIALEDDYDYDNDELFEWYAAEVFGMNDGISLLSSDFQESRLNSQALVIYKHLKQQAKLAADGELDSAVFTVPANELKYTASDLGVSPLFNGTKLTSAASDALREKMEADMDELFNALLGDCPYELYWFDKVEGFGWSYPSYKKGLNGQEEQIEFPEGTVVKFRFYVDAKYSLTGAKRTTDIDTDKTGIAMRSAKNAEKIVDECVYLPDVDKLLHYRDSICDLVEYNHEAAELNSKVYGTMSPWQLIWVFDGDPTTNVVCEGYSKAFQYLCELTDFDRSDVYSLIVTSQTHMWNVVHMEDGENYLVDITNCDTGAAGEHLGLFLKGSDDKIYSGTQTVGYKVTITSTGQVIDYTYDSETLSMYDMKDIALSEEDYDLHDHSATIHDFRPSGVCDVCQMKKTSLEFAADYNPSKKYDGWPLANPTEEELTVTGDNYVFVDYIWYKDSVKKENRLEDAPASVGTYYLVASFSGFFEYLPSYAISDEIVIEKGTPDYTCVVGFTDSYRLKCGETLSDIELLDGFTWEDADVELARGEENALTLTYTPDDLDNYNIVKGIEISVFLEEHTFDEVVEDAHLKTEVSCTEPAVYRVSCTGCGIENGEEFAVGKPIPHVFTDYVSDENATCTEDGTKTAHCDYGCGTTDTVSDEGSHGHRFQNGVCGGCGIRDIAYKGIQVSGLEFIYTGNPQVPVPVLKGADGAVIPSDVYTVQADSQTKSGTYKVTITAKEDSGYIGARVESWVVKKAVPEYTKPTGLTVTCDGTLKDITLPAGFAFINPNMALTAGKTNTVFVTFTPEDTVNYEIVTDIEVSVDVYAHAYKEYKSDGNATCTEDGTKTAQCVYGCGKTDTVPDVDSKLGHRYADAVLVPATSAADGMCYRECERCKDRKTERTIPSIGDISLSQTRYVYSGAKKTPSVIVNDRNGNAIADDFYIVEYANNKRVGEGMVTVTFTGDYEGTETRTFCIVPKSTSLVKLKAKSKAIDVTWKKLTGQTTGYQIQYSTNKNFAGAKTKTISKNKTTKLSLKKLKGKKKYYVRICTYKTVKINGKSKKLCSDWSKAKSVTTRK